MNILVIGNGFDLAHDLPTKYTDFLEFCKVVLAIFTDAKPMDRKTFEDKYLIEWKVNKKIKNELIDLHFCICICNNEKNFLINHPYVRELQQMIFENIWIEYFFQCNMYQKENWIDFESEISKVIQSLDNDMHGLSQVYNIEDIVHDLSNAFLKEKYSDYIDAVQSINSVDNGFSGGISFKVIRDKLLDDLNRLIRVFEIYLCEYVEKIEIEKRSPDIEELKIDHVLSFNYTHTFSELYNVAQREENISVNSFDYIHGEADIKNTIKSNNMVLGIDEYLSKKQRNKDVEFIAFKKYYQRIYKGTGCKYKEWIEKIQSGYRGSLDSEANCRKFLDYAMMRNDLEEAGNWLMKSFKHCENRKADIHNLYIFGHSLDITDKDILRDLILNDNVHTTIFYHDKDTMGQQIANLVKVIGQDELIRRTGGNTKTIEFKPQKPMEPIDKL